jgi:colanic acid/amylovoran biosynthesis glycosyltransferase
LKKHRILYITNSLTANSETFIQNTIRQISKLEYVKIKIFTLQKGNEFLFKNNFYLKFYSILRKTKFNFATYLLLDYLFNLEYDSIYIDFGSNAYNFSDYFKSRNKKMIVHFHGFDISKSLKSKKYLEWLIEFSINNHIIVPSNYNANRLEILGCRKANISVIPYSFYGDYASNRDIRIDFDLIFVGRLVSKKDPRILIYSLKEVVKVFPSVKLCIVGSGYLINDVLQLIAKFNLDSNVILKGSISQSEVYNLLLQSKIYVQHSVTSNDGDQEGFPNSILEASSFGLPVVSTIHAGIPEIIIDGKSGFLVQEYDYMMMANKIIELLSDENLRSEFGNFGRNYILEKCAPTKRISAISHILNTNV